MTEHPSSATSKSAPIALKLVIAGVVLAAAGASVFVFGRKNEAGKGCSQTLTREVLEKSLALGTQFLVKNQKPEGNFQYEYNWRTRKYSKGDNQVRQAGAGWGLATIYRYQPSETVKDALLKALDFMNTNSRLDAKGGRYIIYPGDTKGAMGAVALTALAHIDFLRTEGVSQDLVARYRPFLEQYLAYLESGRTEDHLWHNSFSLENGEPTGPSSSYFDGESLLALVKAAKYLGFSQFKDVIMEAAEAGYQKNIKDALASDPDSAVTKGYYQWSSMAFYEIATSGWQGSEVFGDRLIALADWMIDVHKTLSRGRNTGYAYEGIVHAYKLASDRGDVAHAQKFACVIDQGLEKLTSWQVGSPIANNYIKRRATDDALAIGGVQNSAKEPQLRIDVAQHQMHAVLLTLKYYLTKSN